MEELQTKMIGMADLMLGIKITHKTEAIMLSQNHYIDSLLELYGMSNYKPVSTPLIPNLNLEGALVSEREEFQALKINNISALSQFLENPGIQHWKAFMHVLRYLRGTNNIELNYQKNIEQSPIAYSDADWGNCRTTRRSVTEAEYRSLTHLFSELLWFKQFCEEINAIKMERPIMIHEDNQGCIDTANSDCNTNTRRMKHVKAQLHFIREAIENSIITLVYTPTNNMLADFLTKSVCRPAIKRAMENLRLLPLGDRRGVERNILSRSVSS
ncbi:hypothetical protein O181_018648 [Austropuccinia psidii MF-1]|uniref:Reverse transcriptase Ty1/copia-type domain-containing protein n=1 Tax=Austropuccinia psidii MF-1 TaxID=1389203 RepID=A0A9Q3C9H1_9BASI|nr:hypothetical protein [Austropuccinia psidii MF-1]